ncbi:PLD nuclease N-terminal domain-containing protein [Agromyces sp. NPDC056523]|uniref:PLD nuclease N-terminal domain-containing protein n=1 Tax=Agromyces sp. NPDC056523 TaxID=3345850 RepID=UPI003673042F
MATAKKWSDYSPQQKSRAIVSVAIQLVLAGLAWSDLAKRPADDVNGPKPVWAIVIMVNFIGPVAYFLFGRRRD